MKGSVVDIVVLVGKGSGPHPVKMLHPGSLNPTPSFF